MKNANLVQMENNWSLIVLPCFAVGSRKIERKIKSCMVSIIPPARKITHVLKFCVNCSSWEHIFLVWEISLKDLLNSFRYGELEGLDGWMDRGKEKERKEAEGPSLLRFLKFFRNCNFLLNFEGGDLMHFYYFVVLCKLWCRFFFSLFIKFIKILVCKVTFCWFCLGFLIFSRWK